MEDNENIQKKEYILNEFYYVVIKELNNNNREKRCTPLFSNYLQEYKKILEGNHAILERYNELSDLYGIYSRLPSNLERLYQIFRILSSRATYYRLFNILKIMHENGDIYLTRKELENQLKYIFGSEIKRLPDDIRKLRINSLIKKSGIRYHLTSSGVTIFNSILRLEKELEPDLIEKLSRAVFMHSLYEGKGLDIKTYQHVQQLGFLIQEIIEQAIDRGEVLEWVHFLKKIDQIIKDLNYITELYDEPAIKKILLKTKSKIAREFSRYHKVTESTIKQNLSLIDRGIYPTRLKKFTNLFSLSDWHQLETLLSNNCLPIFLPVLNEELLDAFKNTNDYENDNNEISLEDSIRTEIIDEKELYDTLEIVIPYNKVFASKFLNSSKKNGIFLSQLIKKWKLGWRESSILIGNIPSISGKYPINCGILNKICNLQNMSIREAYLFYNNGGINGN